MNCLLCGGRSTIRETGPSVLPVSRRNQDRGPQRSASIRNGIELHQRIGTGLRALLLAALGLVALLAGCDDPCANDVEAEVPAPGGKMKAIVFTRNCGATTDFVTSVSVLDAEESLPNSAANVFSADTNHGAAIHGAGHGPSVRVKWLAPSVLQVTTEAGARVYSDETHIGDVEVRYVEEKL